MSDVTRGRQASYGRQRWAAGASPIVDAITLTSLVDLFIRLRLTFITIVYYSDSRIIGAVSRCRRFRFNRFGFQAIPTLLRPIRDDFLFVRMVVARQRSIRRVCCCSWRSSTWCREFVRSCFR